MMRFHERGLLLVGAVACGPNAPGKAGIDTGIAPIVLPDAAESGPYAAATRADPILTPSGQSLLVQTWYPTEVDATEPPHVYNDLIASAALDEAPPRCRGPRPVLLFSHGNGGIRFQSIFLTEHLATRGWVVVAPDHEGNTLFDLDSDRAGEHAIRRPRDIRESFDWLVQELAAPGGPLEGCVDPEAGYAVAGHSFGGYTSLALATATVTAEHARACAPGWLCDDTAAWLEEHPESDPAQLVDPRIWASVPMTPAAYELLAPSLETSDLPTLVMGGTLDSLTSMELQVQPIYDALGGEKYLAELDTAGHFTFSDTCTLVPTYEDCTPPFLPLEQAHPLIRGMATAFLEREAGLTDQTGTWLPPADPIVRWEASESAAAR